MKICTHLAEWRALRGSPEWAGLSVGFVPTMGALHAGHEALLARARAENERVVLSVFVNPTQFNDPADLARYPRTWDADVALAHPYVDAVLAPPAEAFYPDGYRYRVTENSLGTQLEGAHRPGHFDGVLTVVLKLLNVVQPHRAYFGEKDWQQLELVHRCRALPGSGTQAIRTRVTTTDDDDVPAGRRDELLVGNRVARAAPVRERQVLHREVNARQVPTGSG